MAGNNSDPTMTLVLFLFLMMGAIFGVWYFFQNEILEGIRYLRLGEMFLLSFFDKHADGCYMWLRYAEAKATIPSQEAIGGALACFGPDFIQSLPQEKRMDYFNISSDSLGYVSRYVGSYLRWILFAVCAYVIYYGLYKTDRKKFRTAFNLESFIEVQSRVWPVISPIVKFNPAKHSARTYGGPVPAKLPLFAESLSPEEWVAFHAIPVTNDIPERQATYNAFVSQIGPRWPGYAKLPPYIQALMAAFALKGVQKRDESDDLLSRISLCWTDKTGFKLTPELSHEINKILKDPAIGGKAMGIIQNHAYRTTALLGVLKWARFMGGVLASAQFLWLRGVDRELWYALNNLGRRSFHMEGAGAMAHFMAEEAAKKPLLVPRLETAIITLNKYLSEKQVAIPPRSDSSGVITFN